MSASKWGQPKNPDRLELGFGPRNLGEYLPEYGEIPDDFKRDSNQFVVLTSMWFFNGLDRSRLKVKPGIDANAALRHLSCVLRSFEPKHEHKEAGVAYLMSLWFEVAS